MDDVFKPDIKTKNLSQSYYDYEVFRFQEREINFELIVWGEISVADSTSHEIDNNIFDRELTALNIELFGLAWLDHNWKLFEEGKLESSPLDNLLLTEIWFTKYYLTHMGGQDIWEAAGFYNDILMQAAIVQKTSMKWDIPRDIPDYYERSLNRSTEKLEQSSWEHYRDEFNKKLDDKECCGRIANRMISCHCWQDGITIPQKLSSAFAQRISFNPNLDALLLIQRVIVGLYNNAASFIIGVEQYGSYELAKKARIDFIQFINDWYRKEKEKQKRSDQEGMQ